MRINTQACFAWVFLFSEACPSLTAAPSVVWELSFVLHSGNTLIGWPASRACYWCYTLFSLSPFISVVLTWNPCQWFLLACRRNILFVCHLKGFRWIFNALNSIKLEFAFTLQLLPELQSARDWKNTYWNDFSCFISDLMNKLNQQNIKHVITFQHQWHKDHSKT